MPVPTIARLYYDPDTGPHMANAELLERRLRVMRDELVRLAAIRGSPIICAARSANTAARS